MSSRSAPQRKNRDIKAINTGATALRRVQASTDLDYIGKQASDMLSEMLDRVQENLFIMIDPDTKNSLGAKLSRKFKDQNQVLQDYIGKGNVSIKELDRRINNFSIQMQNELDRAISSQLSDDKSKLGLLLKQLHFDISGIKDLINKNSAVKKESIQHIGRDAELTAKQSIDNICQTFSLIAEDLRNIPGNVKNSKKGDFRINGDSISPICIEIKFRESEMSLTSILKELEQACLNRKAIAGVFVANSGCLPKQVGLLNFYQNDQFIIYDSAVLDIGLKIALSKAKMLEIPAQKAPKLKIKEAITGIYTIQTMLTKFDSIIKTCNTVTRSSEKLTKLSEKLHLDLLHQTGEVLSMLEIKPN